MSGVAPLSIAVISSYPLTDSDKFFGALLLRLTFKLFDVATDFVESFFAVPHIMNSVLKPAIAHIAHRLSFLLAFQGLLIINI